MPPPDPTDRHAWSEPGVEPVAEGIHRLPLPLPGDGLRAVNVYVVQDGDGLTLIDAGWAIEGARERLVAGLADLGATLADIRRFLVTHVHRDHYTMAVVVRRELGTHISLGLAEKPSLDNLHEPEATRERLVLAHLERCGAHEMVARMRQRRPGGIDDLAEPPDHWFDGPEVLDVAGRPVEVVPTPGHTRGHVVFADREAGVLFAGDHVLPHITPSIGFEPVPNRLALLDYLASLEAVRHLPDLRLLPAHGPVQASTHGRVAELVAHHDDRLARCVDAVAAGARTAFEVASALAWTRRATPFEQLDGFNRMLAVTETAAHLEVLVHDGRLGMDEQGGVAHHGLPATSNDHV